MPRSKRRYVVCLTNEGYSASLEPKKIYVALGLDGAEEQGFVRVIDESGEDYLYPTSRFAEIELPRKVARLIASSA
jgi:hypothetical protein